MKSMNISSTTGRRPVAAAPTAAPRKPISLIGVSRTRSGPNACDQPARDAHDAAPRLLDALILVAPAAAGDVLAQHDHVGIAAPSRCGAPR